MIAGACPEGWAESFPDGLVSVVIDLIISGWALIKIHSLNDGENDITRRLVSVLRQQKRARALPFQIDREVPIDDQDASADQGRLDIRFMTGHDEDIYLAFECKRLRIKDDKGVRRSLSSEYISEGMMRFVDGKYSTSVKVGGMLGYILDGNHLRAVSSIGRLVHAKCTELKLQQGTALDRSELLPDDERVRQTVHALERGQFLIHHLLLRPVNGSIA